MIQLSFVWPESQWWYLFLCWISPRSS